MLSPQLYGSQTRLKGVFWTYMPMIKHVCKNRLSGRFVRLHVGRPCFFFVSLFIHLFPFSYTCSGVIGNRRSASRQGCEA